MTDSFLKNDLSYSFKSFNPMTSMNPYSNKEITNQTDIDEPSLVHFYQKTQSPLPVSKKHTPLPYNIRPSVHPLASEVELQTDNYDGVSIDDFRLLEKEVSGLRKSLKESQARATSSTKELSKMQYESAGLQLQAKKSEMRYQEMLEIHSLDQVRINELTFINNQLSSELAKFKINSKENTVESKGDLRRLRASLMEVEQIVQVKNDKVGLFAKSGLKALETLQSVFQDSNVARQIKEYLQKITKVVELKTIKTIIEEDSLEYDAIRSLNEVIYIYEAENAELKNENMKFKVDIDSMNKERSAISSQYQELREAVKSIKIKVVDIQDSKKAEKDYYEEKIEKLHEMKLKLQGENNTLKSVYSQALTQELGDTNAINTSKQTMRGQSEDRRSQPANNDLELASFGNRQQQQQSGNKRTSYRYDSVHEVKPERVSMKEGNNHRRSVKDFESGEKHYVYESKENIVPRSSLKASKKPEGRESRATSNKFASGLKNEICSLDDEIQELEERIRRESGPRESFFSNNF